MKVITRSIDSPVGPISLVGDGNSLSGAYMTEHKRPPSLGDAVVDNGAFPEAARQLAEWFDSRRTTFDLDLNPAGTPFQSEVWGALVSIPFGQTMTYGELATKVGRPGAARAIGHAVARNPIGIIVPCHRVVGAKGALTGFAAGLDRKRWLLEHERALTLIPPEVPEHIWTLGAGQSVALEIGALVNLALVIAVATVRRRALQPALVSSR